MTPERSREIEATLDNFRKEMSDVRLLQAKCETLHNKLRSDSYIESTAMAAKDKADKLVQRVELIEKQLQHKPSVELTHVNNWLEALQRRVEELEFRAADKPEPEDIVNELPDQVEYNVLLDILRDTYDLLKNTKPDRKNSARHRRLLSEIGNVLADFGVV
jgi:BMFP domain-containing protein YqiC